MQEMVDMAQKSLQAVSKRNRGYTSKSVAERSLKPNFKVLSFGVASLGPPKKKKMVLRWRGLS